MELDMPNAISDTQSLTSFHRQSAELLKRLKQTQLPVLITLRGKATAILQDAEAYQRLLDIAAGASAEEGIRQGLEDARKGSTRPAHEFFAEFEAANGLSR